MPGTSHAQLLPQNFTVEGRLYAVGTTPPSPINDVVNVMLEIVDSSASSCVIYRETQSNVNVASTDPTAQGVFALKLGAGTIAIGNSTPLGAFLLPTSYSGQIEAGAACMSAANSTRYLRIKSQYAANASSWDTLSPDTLMTPVPSALVADTLQGHQASDFILSNTNSQLNQANVENVFSSTNFPILQSLLAGTDNKFIPAAPTAAVDFNGQRLTNLNAPTTATDAVTKSYDDSTLGGQTLNLAGIGAGIGNGKTIVWDQTTSQWVAQSVGSVSSITAGTGLNGGTIVASGTISVDAGTAANQIVQLNAQALLPSVDGSLLFNVNASKLTGRAVSSLAPTAGQILLYNSATSQWEPGNSNGITSLSGDVVATGPGAAVATIQHDAVNASSKIKSSGIAASRLVMTDAVTGTTLTYGVCLNPGDVFQWSATGWGCASVSQMLGNVNAAPGAYGNSTQVAQVSVDATGRVTQLTNVNIAFPVTMVAGRTGAVTLNASDVGGLGTAALQNYGTTPGNLVQLDGTAHIPSSLLPTGIGTITAVVAGNAIVGGGTLGAVTLSADVGTTANKIVQFDSSARYPANDGSQIQNVNASSIASRAVSTTLPLAGQVLTFNTGTGKWDAENSSASSNSFVQGGNTFGAPAILGTNDNNNLVLQSSALPVMTLTPGGLVGIGTSSPVALLHLVSSTITPILELQSPVPSATVPMNFVASNKSYQIGAGGLTSSVPNEFYIKDLSSGAIRLAIDTAGNVGIGSTIPSSLLDLSGALTMRALSSPASSSASQGRIYFDSTQNKFMISQNGSSYTPLLTGGSVTTITAGTGMVANTITTIGTLSVDVGTTANKIVQITADNRYPAVDGSLITNVAASNLMGKPISLTAPSAAQVLTYNSALGIWDAEAPAASASSFVNGGNSFGLAASLGTKDGNPLSFMTNGSTALTINSSQLVGIGTISPQTLLDINGTTTMRGVASTTSASGTGRIHFNSTLNKFMISENGGSYVPVIPTNMVGSIVSGTGLTPSTITSTGTLNVDVGTAANKIVQLNGSAQIPAVDGSLLTGVNAVKLQSRAVASTAPTAGQILSWNSGSLTWTPVDASTSLNGIVPLANGGTASTNGSISSPSALTFKSTGAGNPVMINPGPGSQFLVGLSSFTPDNGFLAVFNGTLEAAQTIEVKRTAPTQLGGLFIDNGDATGWTIGNFGSGNDQLSIYETSLTNAVVTFDSSTGNMGVGTTSPTSPLTVNGIIKTSGGVSFGDGSLQITAAVTPKYDISCWNNAFTYRSYCVQLNRASGASTCKISNNSTANAWSSCGSLNWPASSAGPFQINCFYDNQANQSTCVRLDSLTGLSACLTQTGPTTWSSCLSTPF